jgi:hypothetical protein
MSSVRLIETFRCQTCRTVTSQDYGQAPPVCHGTPMKWAQTREYHPELHGWSTGMKAPAVDFSPSRDRELPIQLADGSQMKMESLHQIRQLEKESQQLAANGEGQELRFRHYSTDRGTGRHLENTFGAPPQRKPQLTRDGKQVVSITPVDGETMDAAEMGPGATEALASALTMDPQ